MSDLSELLKAKDCDQLSDWLREKPLAHFDCLALGPAEEAWALPGTLPPVSTIEFEEFVLFSTRGSNWTIPS